MYFKRFIMTIYSPEKRCSFSSSKPEKDRANLCGCLCLRGAHDAFASRGADCAGGCPKSRGASNAPVGSRFKVQGSNLVEAYGRKSQQRFFDKSFIKIF